MLLWSIQHKHAYEKTEQTECSGQTKISLRRIGLKILSVDGRANEKRIGEPPEGVIFPVGPGTNGKACGNDRYVCMDVIGGEKGTPVVLLTIEVPDNLVLLSDFDYWHCVLNDGEIIFPIDDSAVYSEEEKRKSWENIFDISCSFEGEVHPHLSTQATMWEIKRKMGEKAEYFVAR